MLRLDVSIEVIDAGRDCCSILLPHYFNAYTTHHGHISRHANLPFCSGTLIPV
jgi:hypothetical protein